jgi:sulfatase maturation enzyme AslB (radical SAM superfamily)
MNCAFCGFARALPWSRRHMSWATTETALHGLARAARPRDRRVMISWLGGEPLLWPHLVRASVLAKNLGFALSLTTNGALFTQPALLDFCSGMLDEITLSVDGQATHHDVVRDAAGSWHTLQAACQALRGRNDRLRIRINTILMRSTIGNFEAMCETAAQWGADELSFNALGGNDRPEFHPHNHLLLDQVQSFAAALPGLQRRYAHRGLTIAGGERYLRRIAASARGEAIAVEDCAPGRGFIFMDEQGRAAPCSYSLNEYGIAPDELGALDPGTYWLVARAANRAKACDDCLCTNVFGKFDSA